MAEMTDAAPESASHAAVPGIVRVVGFPGPFLDWGVDIVRAVFMAADRATETHPLPGPDMPPDDASAPVQLLIGTGPNYSLAASEVPTIVFLDGAREALAHLLTTSQDVVGMTRVMTATLAPLGRILHAHGSLLIRPGPAELAWNAVAAHLLPNHNIAAVPIPDWHAPMGQALSPLASEVVEKLLTPMLDAVVEGAQHSYELPWQCLSWRAQEPAVPVMDLAGPARALYFGPYFHFLPGDWWVELELFFSDDVGDASFAAELFADIVISRARMRPGRGGLFRARFATHIHNSEACTELRIWVERGVIEGRIGLRKVTFIPQAA